MASIATVTLLYAIMVDVSPSVVRATILVLVACTSVWLGRRALGFNSLAAAALVVLAMNPAHLFHVGAQLSFLCVAGLIWFAGRRPHGDDEPAGTERTLERLILQNLTWPSWVWRKLRRSVIGIAQAGLLLWVLALPLVLARFHVLSLAGMVANMLLWPLMSVSLLSGFGVLLFGPLCPPLGSLCGWLCDGSFWLVEGAVNVGHRMPCGHFWLPGPADWWLWGFYGAWDWRLPFPGFARRGVGARRCWRCGSPRVSPHRPGGTTAAGSTAPSSASATAARCSSSSPRAGRCSTTPAAWANPRRRTRDFRVPLGSRLGAARRRRALPSRHRPLQRPARVAR